MAVATYQVSIGWEAVPADSFMLDGSALDGTDQLTNAYSDRTFPPFSLNRLLKTVFAPKGGEKVCILIDLPDTALMKDFGFLTEPRFTLQRHAYEVFYQGLRAGVLEELGLQGADMFA